VTGTQPESLRRSESLSPSQPRIMQFSKARPGPGRVTVVVVTVTAISRAGGSERRRTRDSHGGKLGFITRTRAVTVTVTAA
jgi:hypothetical protein